MPDPMRNWLRADEIEAPEREEMFWVLFKGDPVSKAILQLHNGHTLRAMAVLRPGVRFHGPLQPPLED